MPQVARQRSFSTLPSELIRLLTSPVPVSSDESLQSLSRSLSPLDWHAIANDMRGQGVGHLFYQRLLDLGWSDRLDDNTLKSWRADLKHSRIQCDLQRKDAIRVSRDLSLAGIRHAFLKGFVFREWFYKPYWSRPGSDLDVLINRRDVSAAKRVLRKAGFVQASRSSDFRDFQAATEAEIDDLESWHFELVQFARRYRLLNGPDWLMGPDFTRNAPFAFDRLPSGPVLHCVFDIHWALHFEFRGDNPLAKISRFRTAEDDVEIPTLTPEWNLVYTSYKLYYEAFDEPGKGLHKLVDVAGLLSVMGSKGFDWDWIDSIAEKHRMEAALFYTISAAQNITGRALVAASVLDKWRAVPFKGSDFRVAGEGESVRPQTDLGDFVPMMLAERIPSAFPHVSQE